jgi:hypothetical protein
VLLLLLLLLLLYWVHKYWAVGARAGSLHCCIEVLVACQLLQLAERAVASAAVVTAALAALAAARA